MNKLVIGLDVDDVLVDTASAMMEDYNKKYGTDLTVYDYYSKDISRLGVDHYDEAAARFKKYQLTPAFTNGQPISDAVKVLGRLKDRFEFVGITSRPEYVAEATNEWLKKHFDVIKTIYTSFIMGSEDQQSSILSKAEVCTDISAKYMIEDHLAHALPIADEGVTVLLLDRPWNQSVDLPENVIRVRNWDAIEEYLSGR